MKTFYEWFKEQRKTDSMSEMLILCKQAWFDGQRELCLHYDVKEKSIKINHCYLILALSIIIFIALFFIPVEFWELIDG